MHRRALSYNKYVQFKYLDTTTGLNYGVEKEYFIMLSLRVLFLIMDRFWKVLLIKIIIT